MPTKFRCRVRENVLLAQVRLNLGTEPGILLLRINTGVYLSLDGQRHVRSAPNGTPDLLGIAYERPLAIETKARRGKHAEDQIKFQVAWEKVGGVYILARSLTDVWDVLTPLREVWTAEARYSAARGV